MQKLIETTRSQHVLQSHVEIEEVHQVMATFVEESDTDRGSWLRRATGVAEKNEDAEVKELLRDIVEKFFTVLQSLYNSSTDEADAALSAQYIACSALFVHCKNQIFFD